MIDGDPVGPIGCLLGWPGGSLRQWLVALAAFNALLGALTLLFSWMGF